MYEGLIIILTATGIQLTFSWNYHRVYVDLHKEFYKDIEQIVSKRLSVFRDGLKGWMAELFGDLLKLADEKGRHSLDRGNISAVLESFSTDPKSQKKVQELYELVSRAEEPKVKYKEVRESCRALYKYLFASGLSTLLGLFPQLSQNEQLGVLYFVFLFPLMAAAFSWDTYSKAEDELVKLRDEGA